MLGDSKSNSEELPETINSLESPSSEKEDEKVLIKYIRQLQKNASYINYEDKLKNLFSSRQNTKH